MHANQGTLGSYLRSDMQYAKGHENYYGYLVYQTLMYARWHTKQA